MTPTIENPVTDDGSWETPDGGTTWLLVEPSQAWLDQRAADAANQPEPAPDPVEALTAQVAILTAALTALLGGN